MPEQRVVAKACLLAVLTLACYLPAMQGPWLFDDREAIENNRLITEPGHLGEIWFSTRPIDYWPVSYTAFWLQWRLWGDHTTGYHLVNVALHIGAALLAWGALAQLRVPGAWTIALLFALHPVNVETAAWIFQQKTTLAAVGFFGALWAWLIYDETRDRRFAVAAVSLFLFAMLAKTSAVALPPLVLCLAWWRRGRIARADVLASLPLFAVAIALGLVSVWFQAHRAIGDTVIREDGFAARLAGAGWAVWFYLAKALWPMNLAFVYPKWQIDGASLASHLPWLAWLAAAAACWRWRRQGGRPVLLAMAWFVLTLAPVLGFVDIGYMRYSLVADHWQYLAILAPLALVVGGAFHLAQRHGAWAARHVPRLAAAAVGVCCLLTWRQAHCYRSEVALWSDTLAKNPAAWMAHNNLSLALARQNELPAAEDALREALRLAPGDPTIQANLAMVLCRRNKFDESIALARATLPRRPKDAGLHLALGAAYAGRFEDAEALAWLRKAVVLNPRDAVAHQTLGKVLLRQGGAAGASEHFRQAIGLDQENADARVGLAKALASGSRRREAHQELQIALELDPQHAEAHLQKANLLAAEGRDVEATRLLADAVRRRPRCAELRGALAERLAARGQLEQAWMHAREALKLDDQVPEIHAAAGDVRAAQGRAQEAIEHYRRAVKINPHLAEAHKALGGLLASSGRTAEAIDHYRRALSLRSSWPAVSSHLAWLLATRPEASAAEKQEALEWAQRACRETHRQHPVALDTLAAVYAALGQYGAATEAAAQARQRALALGQLEFARQVQSRLDEYRGRTASRSR